MKVRGFALLAVSLGCMTAVCDPAPLDPLINAIIEVESGGDDSAVGDGGQALGCLQIHKIMVDDVNRILGKDEFTYDDRLDREQSIRMFNIYTDHYSRGASDEVIARRWNGGPRGDRKQATVPYWRKVQKQLSSV